MRLSHFNGIVLVQITIHGRQFLLITRDSECKDHSAPSSVFQILAFWRPSIVKWSPKHKFWSPEKKKGILMTGHLMFRYMRA